MDPISFSQMLLRRWWLVLSLSLLGVARSVLLRNDLAYALPVDGEPAAQSSRQ